VTGFTLTNGGGGVWCASTNAFLTNCVIVRNRASGRGGGAYGGTLYHCILSGNHVWSGYAVFPPISAGGGAYGCTLYYCTLTGNGGGGSGGGASSCTLYYCTLTGNGAFRGGGAAECTLYHCTLTGNSAVDYGGGAFGGTLYNCTLTSNSAGGPHGRGGGACFSTLYNCTLTGNSAYYDGGGAFGSTLNNCIVYFNTNGDHSGSTMNYCCTTPMPTNGLGNITNAPLFVDCADGDLRLQTDSPCINAGNNDYVTTSMDLDGNPRISGGVVDIGAYEFAFTPGMAVGQLMLSVDDSDIGTKNKQPLLATLSAALASFDRGNVTSGANQLAAFQNKVRAQVARIDAVLANELIATAQRIIQDVTGRELQPLE
jgi:hypothetical protein